MDGSDAARAVADDAAADGTGEESMEEQDDLGNEFDEFEDEESVVVVVVNEQPQPQPQPQQPQQPPLRRQTTIKNFFIKGGTNFFGRITGGAARISTSGTSGSSGGARGGNVSVTVSHSGGGQQRASASAATSSAKQGSSSSASESIKIRMN